MANLQANLRSLCTIDQQQPDQLLRSVNQLFCENTTDGAFATLFFAEYDDTLRVLRYANCGHLPALLLRADSSVEPWIPPRRYSAFSRSGIASSAKATWRPAIRSRSTPTASPNPSTPRATNLASNACSKRCITTVRFLRTPPSAPSSKKSRASAPTNSTTTSP